MAKLRQQRRIVKTLYKFPYSAIEISDRERVFIEFEEKGIPKEMFISSCKRKYKINFFTNRMLLKQQALTVSQYSNQLYRQLLDSCIEDKFIKIDNNSELRITSRGMDLLHFTGLVEIFLTKYSKTRIFLTSIVGTSFVLTTGKLILKYLKIIE